MLQANEYPRRKARKGHKQCRVERRERFLAFGRGPNGWHFKRQRESATNRLTTDDRQWCASPGIILAMENSHDVADLGDVVSLTGLQVSLWSTVHFLPLRQRAPRGFVDGRGGFSVSRSLSLLPQHPAYLCMPGDFVHVVAKRRIVRTFAPAAMSYC